jgi:hypothetical protein
MNGEFWAAGENSVVRFAVNPALGPFSRVIADSIAYKGGD